MLRQFSHLFLPQAVPLLLVLPVAKINGKSKNKVWTSPKRSKQIRTGLKTLKKVPVHWKTCKNVRKHQQESRKCYKQIVRLNAFFSYFCCVLKGLHRSEQVQTDRNRSENVRKPSKTFENIDTYRENIEQIAKMLQIYDFPNYYWFCVFTLLIRSAINAVTVTGGDYSK